MTLSATAIGYQMAGLKVTPQFYLEDTAPLAPGSRLTFVHRPWDRRSGKGHIVEAEIDRELAPDDGSGG